MTVKLAFPRLHVSSAALDEALEWYKEKLGMQVMRRMDSRGLPVFWIGFPDKPESAHVELRASSTGKKYVWRPETDRYWKIGLAGPDVDTARKRLVDGGVSVTRASQFRDIGYVCHLKDPSGYSIELLQYDFEKHFSRERVATLLEDKKPLGQRVHIGQITLRAADIAMSIEFYKSVLGMKLLSRQSVPGSFDLYFLGCTEEEPPVEDIDAIEIREWLWRRPYTTLELQSYEGKHGTRYTTSDLDSEIGFSALCFSVNAERFEALKRTYATADDISKECPEYDTSVLEMQDPDGTTVVLLCE